MLGFYGIHIGYMIGNQIRVDAPLRFSCKTLLHEHQGQIIIIHLHT